jgi:hypothetical protein
MFRYFDITRRKGICNLRRKMKVWNVQSNDR